jgi:hypothetical protein
MYCLNSPGADVEGAGVHLKDLHGLGERWKEDYSHCGFNMYIDEIPSTNEGGV